MAKKATQEAVIELYLSAYDLYNQADLLAWRADALLHADKSISDQDYEHIMNITRSLDSAKVALSKANHVKRLT